MGRRARRQSSGTLSSGAVMAWSSAHVEAAHFLLLCFLVGALAGFLVALLTGDRHG